jgi:hypothetical protein
MDVSGTLHLYAGEDRELFFAFDDEIAQQLYEMADFNVDDKASRRVSISVGCDRFISQRTLSFSRKQREIKVSLCKATTKNGLASLTKLYDWFAPVGMERPKVAAVVGSLRRVRRSQSMVWELAIEEPVGLVAPPGLKRRLKVPSRTQRSYAHRRKIIEKELAAIGRLAEARALTTLTTQFRHPNFSCLWRDSYLDSEKEAVRRLGIICDIDIWDNVRDRPSGFIEVKAQQVRDNRAAPQFFLSSAEWKSFQYAIARKMDYRVWLVQYADRDHLANCSGPVRILECMEIKPEWMVPETSLVVPNPTSLRSVKAR